MAERKTATVFVFNGPNAAIPSGVFESLEAAESWIRGNHLSGLLTEYPLGVGVYDWAVAAGRFKPKRPDQQSPHFIARFTCGALWHGHYENGESTEASVSE